MSNGFVNPITIKEAIDNIEERTYLLPAIQRKFVWSSDQIEVLFEEWYVRGHERELKLKAIVEIANNKEEKKKK